MADQELKFILEGDAAGAVAAFQKLEQKTAETSAALDSAQTEANRLGQTFAESEAKTNSLAIQWALGRKALQELGESAGKTSAEYQTLKAEVGEMEAAYKRQAVETKNLEKSYGSAQIKAAELQAALAKQRETLSQSSGNLEKAGIDVNNLAKEYDRLKVSAEVGTAFKALDVKPIELQRAEIARLEQAYQTLKNSGTVSAADLGRAHEAMKTKIANLNPEIAKTSDLMNSLRKTAIEAFAAFGAVHVTRDLIETAAGFERIDNALKAVTGDSETASREFEFVRQVSNRLGLEIESTALAYMKLAASARGTALEGEQTHRIFESIANAMRKTGGDSAQLEGALQSIGKMMSVGVVNGSMLRRQMESELPGAFHLAADAMGVTTVQLNDMLSRGEVMATDLLPKLANQLDKTFGTEKADSIASNLGRMGNALHELKESAGDLFHIKDIVAESSGAIEHISDDFLAFSSIADDSLEKLQNQHDALVRLKSDITEQDLWGYYTGKLMEVDAAMEKLAQSENHEAEAAQKTKQAHADALLIEEQRREGLKKYADGMAALEKITGSENQALQSGQQARVESLKAQLAMSETSAKEAAAADKHIAALTFERDAIAKAGELRKMEIDNAKSLIAEKNREVEMAKLHLTALEQEADADSNRTNEEKEAIASAKADVAAKQQQANAARLHAAELSRLPAELAKITDAQALESQEVRKAYNDAYTLINAAKERRKAVQEGTGTTKEADAADEAAAVAVAKLTEAVSLNAQAQKADTAAIADRADTEKRAIAAVAAEKAAHNAAVASQNAKNRADEASAAAARHAEDQAAIHDGESMGVVYENSAAILATFGEKGREALLAWNNYRTDSTDEYDRWIRYANDWIKSAQQQQDQVDALTEALKRATATGEGLWRYANASVGGFDKLDAEKLAGLQSAIDAAKAKMQQLNDESKSTLQGIQDELYQLEGNARASEEMRYQNKLAELQAKLQQANQAGARQAISDLQQALQLEEQIHAKKMANISQEQMAKISNTNVFAYPGTAEAGGIAAAPKPERTVRLELATPAGVIPATINSEHAAILDKLAVSRRSAM